MNFEVIFTFVIIPLLIFFSRVLDVSIGTLRVILLSKGYRIYAPILGFFEVLIWLVAINQVMNNLTNIYTYLAYAGGFAAGTYSGMLIEEKLSLGKVMVRVFVKKKANSVFSALKKKGYPATCLSAQGSDGKMKLLILATNRKLVGEIIETVKTINPHALYTIEDVRYVYQESTPVKTVKHRFGFFRKSK